MLDIMPKQSEEKIPDDKESERLAADSWFSGRKASSFTKDGPVVLDVGGDIFTTSKKVLAQYPNTR